MLLVPGEGHVGSSKRRPAAVQIIFPATDCWQRSMSWVLCSTTWAGVRNRVCCSYKAADAALRFRIW